MHRRLKNVSAAALALALVAGTPGLAQVMLEESARLGLIELGIDTSDIGMITTDQAAQIQNILNSSEGAEDQRARINQVLGEEGMVTSTGGITQLQDAASTEMARLGLSTDVVPTLTLTQLASIQNVANSSEDDETKKARIEAVLGGTMEDDMAASESAAMLQESVMAELAVLGIATDDLPPLTVTQLAEIENVMATSEDSETKKARVEEIIGQ